MPDNQVARQDNRIFISVTTGDFHYSELQVVYVVLSWTSLL